MQKETWANPYVKEDMTGKMTHSEAIKALLEGNTVTRLGVTLCLDSKGKVNHTFTDAELHSNEWTVVEDVTIGDAEKELENLDEGDIDESEQDIEQDVDSEEEEETPIQDEEVIIEEEDVAVEIPDEKTVLQNILICEGVEFSPRLGVKKLQALVDGLDSDSE